jgi:hypothetical protein
MDHLYDSFDDVSGSIRTVDFAHHEIHEGDAFTVHYSVTTAATDAHRTAIMFATPDSTTKGHFIVTASASHPAEVIINEGPTLADAGDGTDLVIKNRNRTSTATSTMASLEDTPTVGSVTTMDNAEWTAVGPSAGLELVHVYLAGGDGPFAVGGTTRSVQEWVLDTDTIYLVYLENTGANANTHSLHLDWYEHVDSN